MDRGRRHQVGLAGGGWAAGKAGNERGTNKRNKWAGFGFGEGRERRWVAMMVQLGGNLQGGVQGGLQRTVPAARSLQQTAGALSMLSLLRSHRRSGGGCCGSEVGRQLGQLLLEAAVGAGLAGPANNESGR